MLLLCESRDSRVDRTCKSIVSGDIRCIVRPVTFFIFYYTLFLYTDLLTKNILIFFQI